MIKTIAYVTEVERGAVRLRVGAPGHQHRILFSIPDEHGDAFRRALESGEEIGVWIEVPE